MTTRLAPVLVLTFVGVTLSVPLNAQDSMDEIVVTARKREESLQDIPVSISTVSSEVIERLGVDDLSGIAELVPGLTFDRSVTQNDFRPAIRGLQAEQGRTSVGILIDDIDITSENLQVPGGGSLARQRLMDVERVEVVKGPQAALYGRSAFGGAVNFITKRPDLREPDARVTLDANSESAYDMRAAGGIPIVEDTFAVRFNAYWFDQQGSYRNTVSNDYVGGGEGQGIAGAFLYEPNDALSFYGRYEFSDNEFDPQAAFVINGNTDINLSPEAQTVLGIPTTRIFTGEVVDGDIRFDIDPRTGADYNGYESETHRVTLIADADLGGLALKSLSSYVDAADTMFQDNDFVSGSVNGVVTGAFQETERNNSTQQISQELRLSSNTEGPFQWLVGGLYWEEEISQFGSNDTGLALGPILDSDVAAFFDARDGAGRGVARDTTHRSIFAWGEYAFNDRWSGSLEFRYTEEDIDYFLDFDPPFDFFFGVISTGGMSPPILVSFGAVSGTDFARITEKYGIPKLTVKYQPSDDWTLYGSVGKGIKPSGFQSGAIFALDRPYSRETLWSYEIGSKNVFQGGTLLLNTALFFQDYTDQQVSSQIFNQQSQQLQPVIENAGKSTIWGFEVDGRWQPTERFTLNGGYTYINAEFDEFRVISTSASRIGESGCGQLLTFGGAAPPACLLIKDGNRPADLPEHQLTLTGNYTAPLNPNWDWYLEGNVRYTSERFLSTANVATQEAYSRVALRLGLQNERFEIMAYVDNLFDDDTVTDGNLYVDFFNGFAPSAFGYRPDPRTAGLRFRWQL